jgi:hypothetical protein
MTAPQVPGGKQQRFGSQASIQAPRGFERSGAAHGRYEKRGEQWE